MTADMFIFQMMTDLRYYRDKASTNSPPIEIHMTWALYQLLAENALAKSQYNKLPVTVSGAPIKIVSDSGLKYWISFVGTFGVG